MCRGCRMVGKSCWQVVRPWTHYLPPGDGDKACLCQNYLNLRGLQCNFESCNFRFHLFSMFFPSVVRQMPGSNPQKRGTARSLPKVFVLLYVLNVLCRSVYCVFVCVCKRVLYYGHRVTIQLQLTNISFHYFRFCVLRSGDSH